MKQVVLFFLFPFAIALGQTAHEVTPSANYQWFTEGITVFPVCDGEALTIEQVSQPDFQANFRSDSVFWQGCKHWLRVQLYSSANEPLQYLLRNTNRFGTSHYFLLQKDSSFKHLKSGVTVPPAERAYPYARYDAIPVILLPQDTLTLFILQDFITEEKALKIRLSYRDWGTAEIKQQAAEHNTLLITFAAFGLLIAYNLAIFVFVKDRAYLYYSLTFFFLLPYLLVSNYTEWQWTYLNENTKLWPDLLMAIPAFSGLFYNLFSLHYLKGKNDRFRGETIFRKCMIFFSFSLLHIIPLGLTIGFDGNTDIYAFADTTLFVTVFLIFVYSVVLSFKGSPTARYFAWSSVAFLPFLAIFYLQDESMGHFGYLDLIEGNAFTRASLKVGMVVQALMFALALAARINIMRKDLAAQELKVERVEREKLQTINQLIEQQNIELEAKVDARTRSLQEANEELRISEENLEQLNNIKNRLFAVVAHDLRGPITSFQGISSVLNYHIKKKQHERLEEIAGQMDESAHQINTLLDNLLRWAQLQMGGVVAKPQQIELQPIVEDIVHIYQGAASLKGLKTIFRISPESLTAWIDPALVGSIVRNVWSNAIKFTDSGTVQLSAFQEENRVYIEITDTGEGIAEEKLASLFDLNSVKSTKGTQGEKGNGLGLYLCKEFVERCNGEITVSSEVGKGTTVRLWLPKAQE